MGSVSVVLPTFNAAAFVGRAIRSALDQTEPPLEVIVVDDASTDGTVQTARALGQADDRLRIITLPVNGGPAAARNVGLAEARGDWIAILDADDAFAGDRLARLAALGETEQADIVTDNICYYDAVTAAAGDPGVESDGAPSRVIDIYAFMARARPYAGPMDWGLLKPMFRRDFIESHHLRYPEHSRHGEDFLLMTEALLRGARYVLHHELGYFYTARNAGLSRTRIDYEEMARQTMSLLHDPRIRTNKELVRLVRTRADSVRRLKAELRLEQHLTSREYGALLRDAAGSPRLSALVARRALGKAKRTFGLT